MKKCVNDFELKDKTVVLRCDFNVSLLENGEIADDTRIVKSLKTINYILDNGARLVIMSHLGKVKNEEDKQKYSMRVVYERLNELLNGKVLFVPYTSDISIRNSVNSLDYGKAILLENTRFEDLNGKRESECDMELAKFWASLGDIFINDAFGTIHRKHASNYGISSLLPSGIGFLVSDELNHLDILDNPKRPYAVIMGGAKVSDKIKIIDSLIEHVDKLFIGGAMAFTFLKSQGINVGLSKLEDDYLDYCRDLLTKYVNKIILPIDFYGSLSFSNDGDKKLVYITDITDDFIGMDIGKQTIDMFNNEIADVNTLFWNGPLGVYEFSNYQNGTIKVLDFVSKNVSTSILGGGDIVTCANNFGYGKGVSFISTGGGASLEYLVNKDLPGIINIEDK